MLEAAGGVAGLVLEVQFDARQAGSLQGGIKWVSALRWKSASMMRIASRAHWRWSTVMETPSVQDAGRRRRRSAAPLADGDADEDQAGSEHLRAVEGFAEEQRGEYQGEDRDQVDEARGLAGRAVDRRRSCTGRRRPP